VEKKVRLRLIGLDGNAHALMGVFSAQARSEGWTSREIDAVLEEAMQGDYAHLLGTLAEYCDQGGLPADE
jgi:hypothetical protein